MRVFAVPRSTPIAFAGKSDPALKKGQRIQSSVQSSLGPRRSDRTMIEVGAAGVKVVERESAYKALA
jgi:hypothetical protein